MVSRPPRNAGRKSETVKQGLGRRRFQIEEMLLDRVQAAIEYQVERDGPDVRESILHFATLETAPVQELSAG